MIKNVGYSNLKEWNMKKMNDDKELMALEELDSIDNWIPTKSKQEIGYFCVGNVGKNVMLCYVDSANVAEWITERLNALAKIQHDPINFIKEIVK